jgi:BlaI family transcriptional regulator, penicillinase repressor
VSDSRRPTDSETEILAVLWEHGPSTVRQVHEVVGDRRGVGYTTVLKLLQIMTDKGLVERESVGRSHVYTASAPQAHTQAKLVDDLVDRAFGGSASALVMRALGSRPASRAELDEIRKLLDDLSPSPRRGGGEPER